MYDLEKVKAYFNKDQYAVQTTGAEIIAADLHYAKCKLCLDKRHINCLGQIMGGVMYTLADFVFAVATNYNQPPTVTAVSQITYLEPVGGTVLYGESKMLRDGKHTCCYEIKITDDLGTNIAAVTMHGFKIQDQNDGKAQNHDD